MHSTTRRRISVGAGALALTSVAFIAGAQDFEAFPSSARSMKNQITGRQVTLIEAVKLAEESSGGVAFSATFRLPGQEMGSGAEVHCYTDTGHHLVLVDGISGEVASDIIIPDFPGLTVEGAWQETASGLRYVDIVEGDGQTPAGPTSSVTVHYSGYLNDGTMFDSSYTRNQPATFQLNGVIAGWTEGVGSMKVGGKRKLMIPFALAYGEGGRGSIPPRATLIFDIELISVQD